MLNPDDLLSWLGTPCLPPHRPCHRLWFRFRSRFRFRLRLELFGWFDGQNDAAVCCSLSLVTHTLTRQQHHLLVQQSVELCVRVCVCVRFSVFVREGACVCAWDCVAYFVARLSRPYASKELTRVCVCPRWWECVLVCVALLISFFISASCQRRQQVASSSSSSKQLPSWTSPPDAALQPRPMASRVAASLQPSSTWHCCSTMSCWR